MGLRIKTNVPSIASQRYLSGNFSWQQKQLEKIASGQRINKAADDAAGLAISEKNEITHPQYGTSRTKCSTMVLAWCKLLRVQRMKSVTF